eukprot:CAMPEP_0113942514 /NCGR_PEP_ID=MMETSP1339-20121228/8222_1 /TAXON_ID=94617 /ORGANISM="Fibrocapsa japonica" /LENGTH=122 /DNA_ID=CAMNT_0000947025 /DNA_START=82 /DNA_END=450 /DNA_ORIENTATION=+ /assembly_acc=CAM_ASM_000762
MAAKQIASDIGAKAIVVFTQTGSTVLAASQLRPDVPLIGITPSTETGRFMAIARGVYPACVDAESKEPLKSMMAKACRICLERNIAESPNDKIIITAGLPLGVPGVANVLRVIPAGGPQVGQ